MYSLGSQKTFKGLYLRQLSSDRPGLFSRMPKYCCEIEIFLSLFADICKI